VGIKEPELITSADIHPQSQQSSPTISSSNFIAQSSDVLNIASLDGVLEIDSAERARARVLALDRVGAAGGAVIHVVVVVGAGACRLGLLTTKLAS
jgi:hypothetical protein